jgi:CBS domain-containing protein
VQPGDDLMTVLRVMSEHDVNQIPVVERRELVGMLDRGDVMRFVEVRRDLGAAAAPRKNTSAETPADPR